MAKRKKFQVAGPINGEYRVDDLFRGKPKFAIVNMEENKGDISAVDLAKNLLDQGFQNVRFCDDICALPEVKTMMEMHQNEIQKQNGKVNGSLKNGVVNGNGNAVYGNMILESGEILNGNLENKVGQENGDVKDKNIQTLTSQIQMPPLPLPLTNPFAMNPAFATQCASAFPLPNLLQYLPKAINDPAGLFGSLLTDSKVARSQKPSQAKSEAAKKRKAERENPLPEEFMKCLMCSEKVQITKEVCMRKHIKMHLDIRAFKCTECHFGSEQWNAVVSHIKQSHNSEKVPINEEKVKDQEIKDMIEKLFPTREFQMEILRTTQAKINVQNAQRFVSMGNISSGMVPTLELMGKTKKEKNGRTHILDNIFALQIFQQMIQKQDPESVGSSDQQSTTTSDDSQPAQEKPEIKKYQCYQCKQDIKCYAGYELPSDGPLANHLRNFHSGELVVYKCPICHWKNEVEYKVRRHICFRHSEVAAKTNPIESRKGGNWRMYLRRNYTQLMYNGLLPADEEDIECGKIEKDKEFTKALVLQKHYGIPIESNWVPPSKRVKQDDICTIDE